MHCLTRSISFCSRAYTSSSRLRYAGKMFRQHVRRLGMQPSGEYLLDMQTSSRILGVQMRRLELMTEMLGAQTQIESLLWYLHIRVGLYIRRGTYWVARVDLLKAHCELSRSSVHRQLCLPSPLYSSDSLASSALQYLLHTSAVHWPDMPCPDNQLR